MNYIIKTGNHFSQNWLGVAKEDIGDVIKKGEVITVRTKSEAMTFPSIDVADKFIRGVCRHAIICTTEAQLEKFGVNTRLNMFLIQKVAS